MEQEMKCTECGWIGERKELQTITPRGTHDRCPECFSVNTADVFIDQIKQTTKGLEKITSDEKHNVTYQTTMNSGAKISASLDDNTTYKEWVNFVRKVFSID